jgi:hypothetical protein
LQSRAALDIYCTLLVLPCRRLVLLILKLIFGGCKGTDHQQIVALISRTTFGPLVLFLFALLLNHGISLNVIDLLGPVRSLS